TAPTAASYPCPSPIPTGRWRPTTARQHNVVGPVPVLADRADEVERSGGYDLILGSGPLQRERDGVTRLRHDLGRTARRSDGLGQSRGRRRRALGGGRAGHDHLVGDGGDQAGHGGVVVAVEAAEDGDAAPWLAE